MGLRLRINLIIAMITLFAFLLGSALIIYTARNAVIDEVTSTLLLASDLLEASNQPTGTIEFNNVRHLRLAEVIALDSNQEVILNDGQIQGVPDLFVSFVQPDQQYLNRKLHSLDTGDFYLIADPSDEIQEAWHESKLFLSVLLLLTLVISAAIYLVLGRALKPIKPILEALAEIEGGHYRKRLPDFDLSEFSRISRSFNTMAEKLDHSQAENSRLSEEMLNMQEHERRYLARELHDEMGQSLSAIKALAASSRALDAPNLVAENLTAISHICDDLFKVVRDMMQRLRPQVLDDLGLIPALEELVQKWRVQSDCHVALHIDPLLTNIKLDNDIHMYRIVQEAVTNAIKHSDASEILINITATKTDNGKQIEIAIIDNGNGFEHDEILEGTGLHGISERAASLGAKLDIQSHSGDGTQVTVSLPVS